MAADDFEGAEEGIDEKSIKDATEELALAQGTVLATFEARLSARDEAL